MDRLAISATSENETDFHERATPVSRLFA